MLVRGIVEDFARYYISRVAAHQNVELTDTASTWGRSTRRVMIRICSRDPRLRCERDAEDQVGAREPFNPL